MSFGAKIFSLLFILIVLIVYTVVNFDYNQIQKSSNKTVNKNENFIDFDTQNIINYIENIKNKALEIKNELIKDNSKLDENLSSKTLEQESLNEQKVQDKLISDDDMVDKELVKNEKESNKNNLIKPKEEPAKEEVLEPEETKITLNEIQKKINTILEDNRIIFKRRSVDITKDSLISVEKIANILKEYKELKVEIAGHTDSRGRASLNLKISQDRANSVKKILLSLGISKDRLKAVGYGEKFPVAKDDKNGLSAINRRVEINIIGEN